MKKIWEIIVHDQWRLWQANPSKHVAIFLGTMLLAEFSTAFLIGKIVENRELKKIIKNQESQKETMKHIQDDAPITADVAAMGLQNFIDYYKDKFDIRDIKDLKNLKMY